MADTVTIPREVYATVCNALQRDADSGMGARAELLADMRATATPPLADVPIAWLTEDGDRCITATTMNGAIKDGGAILSSLSAFTVPAYAAALRARSAVPEGFVLVPVEPTEAMIRACLAEFYKAEKSFDTSACYRAMLAGSKGAT